MENFDLFEEMLLSFCNDKRFFIPISKISLSRGYSIILFRPHNPYFSF
jgi:hypothetical protein